MLIHRIAEARTLDSPAPHDLHLDAGTIAASRSADEGAVLDVGGRAVVPAFVDAHVHLDKAFVPTDGPVDPDLDAAIAAVADLRTSLTLDVVAARARRAVDTMVGHGTVAARVHVEIDPVTGLAPVDLHLELAAEVADRCALQLVAFPQRGLATTEARTLLADAMSLGLGVVGGCPYVDDDPLAHLDEVFALADRLGVPVDLHLDFDDDPARSLLAAVAERTIALGLQGRVLVGHATSLAVLAPDRQRAVLDLMAAAGLGLVALPFSDLHLVGHGHPGHRSIAPVALAAAAGVAVAIATNNLANPFAPSGNGSLLHAAWLVGVVQRASGSADEKTLLDAITTTPAALLGLEAHGTAVGAAAHLAVVDASEPDEVVRRCPAVVATLRAGALVGRREVAEVRPVEVVSR